MYTGILSLDTSLLDTPSLDTTSNVEGSRPSLAWNVSFMDAPMTSAWQNMALRLPAPLDTISDLALATALLITPPSRLYGSHSAFLHTVGLDKIFTRAGLAAASGVSACISPPAVT